MTNHWHQSAATVALCVSTAVAAQSAGERKEIINSTQASELARLAAESQAKFEREEARVLVYLSKHPDQRRSFERNGSTYYLARLDADGNPVYIKPRNGHSITPTAPARSTTSESSHGGGSR